MLDEGCHHRARGWQTHFSRERCFLARRARCRAWRFAMNSAKRSVSVVLLFLLSACAALLAAGCSPKPEATAPSANRSSWIDKSKLIDLTHDFDATTLYWPTNQPFRLTRVAWGRTPGGWWYASNDYSASEHGGTHTDAPIHFHEGGWTLDRIPLERLIGPAAVVDVRAACQENPDYAATAEDIRAWE